jgi:competence protein ComEC
VAREPVRPAERWSFVVRLRRPHGALNFGGFDFEGWMLERNLRGSGHVRSAERLDAMVWRPTYAIGRVRAGLRAIDCHSQSELHGMGASWWHWLRAISAQ